MKLTIISFIVAIVMLVANHVQADHDGTYPTWKLDELLEEHDYDYRKEIKEDVFKPCLQHYLRKIETTNASLGWNQDEKLISAQLSSLAIDLRKIEPSIYYEVIKQDAEMRKAIYAVVLAQCKKKVDEDW